MTETGAFPTPDPTSAAEPTAREAAPASPADTPEALAAAADPRRPAMRFLRLVPIALICALAMLAWHLDQLARIRADLATSLDARVAQLMARTTRITGEQARLRSRGEALSSQLDQVQGQAASLNQELVTGKQQRQALIQANAQREGQISELNQGLETERARAHQLTAQNADLADALGEAREELQRIGKQLADLDDLVSAMTERGHNVQRLSGRESTPRLRATVLQVLPNVNPPSVILSVGGKDRIEKGDEFVVLRGSQRIASLEVRHVEPNRTGAWIVSLESGYSVEPGDEAFSGEPPEPPAAPRPPRSP